MRRLSHWSVTAAVFVSLAACASSSFAVESHAPDEDTEPSRLAESDGEAGDSPADASDDLEFGVGLRIGGVGFRHVRNAKLGWADCRMNGTGLFATLDFHRNFFAELSADYYHATGKTVDAGMDRLSLYVLGSIGARLLPDALVSPYLQAGIGPEWTRIDVEGSSRSVLLAAPFMGVGGELNLGSLRLGANIRSYAMGLPDHLEGSGGSQHSHDSDGVPVRYEAAGQVQFLARWVF